MCASNCVPRLAEPRLSTITTAHPCCTQACSRGRWRLNSCVTNCAENETHGSHGRCWFEPRSQAFISAHAREPRNEASVGLCQLYKVDWLHIPKDMAPGFHSCPPPPPSKIKPTLQSPPHTEAHTYTQLPGQQAHHKCIAPLGTSSLPPIPPGDRQPHATLLLRVHRGW